jgi:hypothetical protein
MRDVAAAQPAPLHPQNGRNCREVAIGNVTRGPLHTAKQLKWAFVALLQEYHPGMGDVGVGSVEEHWTWSTIDLASIITRCIEDRLPHFVCGHFGAGSLSKALRRWGLSLKELLDDDTIPGLVYHTNTHCMSATQTMGKWSNIPQSEAKPVTLQYVCRLGEDPAHGTVLILNHRTAVKVLNGICDMLCRMSPDDALVSVVLELCGEAANFGALFMDVCFALRIMRWMGLTVGAEDTLFTDLVQNYTVICQRPDGLTNTLVPLLRALRACQFKCLPAT